MLNWFKNVFKDFRFSKNNYQLGKCHFNHQLKLLNWTQNISIGKILRYCFKTVLGTCLIILPKLILGSCVTRVKRLYIPSVWGSIFMAFILYISYLMISLLLWPTFQILMVNHLCCLCSCLLRWVPCWTTLCYFTILTVSKMSPSYWGSITGWVKHYKKVKIDT